MPEQESRVLSCQNERVAFHHSLVAGLSEVLATWQSALDDEWAASAAAESKLSPLLSPSPPCPCPRGPHSPTTSYSPVVLRFVFFTASAMISSRGFLMRRCDLAVTIRNGHFLMPSRRHTPCAFQSLRCQRAPVRELSPDDHAHVVADYHGKGRVAAALRQLATEE